MAHLRLCFNVMCEHNECEHSLGSSSHCVECDRLEKLRRKVEPNKLFVYGILKRGYELDLSNTGGKFLGEASIQGAVLYGIGWIPEGLRNQILARKFHGVGLKLDVDSTKVAHGELWEIPNRLWKWLDDIERNGFCYTRKVVQVLQVLVSKDKQEAGDYVDISNHAVGMLMTNAWVYEYTHPNFRAENPIEGGVF